MLKNPLRINLEKIRILSVGIEPDKGEVKQRKISYVTQDSHNGGDGGKLTFL